MVKNTVKVLLMMAAGLAVMAISGVALAQPEALIPEVEVARQSARGWIAIGAGVGLGLAAFGGALGLGRAAAAALDGIARNPGASGKVFMPFILALALIEAMVIYSLVIAFLLVFLQM
jgi:F-type H+-transporting ATPase subunit c